MKDKIILYIKLVLLVWPGIMGFLFMYLFAWFGFGLPIEWWSSALLVALAVLSEYAVIRWLGRTDNA